MAKVGCVPNTLRQNRTVKCKERPVDHKHTTLVHEKNQTNISVHQKNSFSMD